MKFKTKREYEESVIAKFDRLQMHAPKVVGGRGVWLKDWAAKELGKKVVSISDLCEGELMLLEARLSTHLTMAGEKA